MMDCWHRRLRSASNKMSTADVPAVERIIANTINATARGDPDALAARIVAALGEAGYRIVPANGIEDTASGSQPRMEQLYRSPNGDTWFLARDPTTGLAFVRHQANASSGGRVSDVEIADFLGGPQNPERDALLRVIGTSIIDPQGPRLRTNWPRKLAENGRMRRRPSWATCLCAGCR